MGADDVNVAEKWSRSMISPPGIYSHIEMRIDSAKMTDLRLEQSPRVEIHNIILVVIVVDICLMDALESLIFTSMQIQAIGRKG